MPTTEKLPPSFRKRCLLNIPVEVRIMILERLLVTPEDIEPQVWTIWEDAFPSKDTRAPLPRKSSKKVPVHATTSVPEKTLAIARTCKQLLNEALPVYYGCNTFRIDGFDRLQLYLEGIGKDRRQLLKNLDIVYSVEKNRFLRAVGNGVMLLCSCVQLRSLVIRVDYEKDRYRDLFQTEALKIVREIKGCKKIVVEVKEVETKDLLQNIRFLNNTGDQPYEKHVMRFKRIIEEVCRAKEKSRS